MYSYDSFETLGSFTLLRPIFVSLIFAEIMMFFIIIFPHLRTKIVNGLSVIGLSIVSIVISSQLLFYEGIIVDELGLGGDVVTSYMFLIIGILAIVNPTIYIVSRKKTQLK
ncbi:hypothetical protein LC087_16220 [Bacillus carboniphilus]|uniref:Uncharacterized protein n=1 Tax=Bacillus carboniphilus TaxID=86663 RepID=A0ABY9JUZ1_9BACI|nr:hypothetical protein [Bacillus carboniphilus]WLR42257.1 hypothetical protein LC087_16220 [Bacillus carboniphilus]